MQAAPSSPQEGNHSFLEKDLSGNFPAAALNRSHSRQTDSIRVKIFLELSRDQELTARQQQFSSGIHLSRGRNCFFDDTTTTKSDSGSMTHLLDKNEEKFRSEQNRLFRLSLLLPTNNQVQSKFMETTSAEV